MSEPTSTPAHRTTRDQDDAGHRLEHRRNGIAPRTRVWLLGRPETALVVDHGEDCPACVYVGRHCAGHRVDLLLEAEDGRRWRTSRFAILDIPAMLCAFARPDETWPAAQATAGDELAFDALTFVRVAEATIALVDGRPLCRATGDEKGHVRCERLDGVADTIHSIDSDDAGWLSVALANNPGRPTKDVFEWMTTRARLAREKEGR